MKFLLIGDFGGNFPDELVDRLREEEFDYILSQGDYADIKKISSLFKKYGLKYVEMLGGEAEVDKIRTEGAQASEEPLRKISSFGKLVYLVRGNNEHKKYDVFRNIANKFENLNFIDYSKIEIGGVTIVGYPNEMPPEEKEKTEEFVRKFKEKIEPFDPNKTILLTHYPPKDCDLDKLPDDSDNFAKGKHIGSPVIESLIEIYNFPIVVCGHLEEYQAECKKGKSRIINPGAGDLKKYAILDINDKDLAKSKVYFKSV